MTIPWSGGFCFDKPEPQKGKQKIGCCCTTQRGTWTPTTIPSMRHMVLLELVPGIWTQTWVSDNRRWTTVPMLLYLSKHTGSAKLGTLKGKIEVNKTTPEEKVLCIWTVCPQAYDWPGYSRWHRRTDEQTQRRFTVRALFLENNAWYWQTMINAVLPNITLSLPCLLSLVADRKSPLAPSVGGNNI